MGGVSAFVLMEPAETLLETLRAFGGQRALSVSDATHVIVSDNLTQSELSSIRAHVDASIAQMKPIVGVSWLTEVVSSSSNSPWDQALLNSHVPFVIAGLCNPIRQPTGFPVQMSPSPASSRAGVQTRSTDANPLCGSLHETWDF